MKETGDQIEAHGSRYDAGTDERQKIHLADACRDGHDLVGDWRHALDDDCGNAVLLNERYEAIERVLAPVKPQDGQSHRVIEIVTDGIPKKTAHDRGDSRDGGVDSPEHVC